MADSDASGDTDYEYELTARNEEIAAVLSGVLDGVLTGTIWFGDGVDAVSVGVPDELTLVIEFEAENEQMDLELGLEWPAPGEDFAATSNEARPGGTHEKLALVEAADASQSEARFQVFNDRAEECRWRLRHRDGKVIATGGEGYTRRQNAERELRSGREKSSEPEITEEATH